MTTGLPIELPCGVDWSIVFTHTDGAGNAVAVNTPKMEIRQFPNSGAPLLYTSEGGTPTITLTVASNVVTAAIAGATTKNQLVMQAGYWDCYAIETVSGKQAILGSGTFTSDPNTTEL